MNGSHHHLTTTNGELLTNGNKENGYSNESKRVVLNNDKASDTTTIMTQKCGIKNNTFQCSSNAATGTVYWKEGISKKGSFLSLKNWSALSLTLDGRDKLTKTLQYICRLLAWWYSSSKKGSSAAAQGQAFYNLYKSLAMSRKAFRLGRFVIEFEKLTQILPQIQFARGGPSSSTTTTKQSSSSLVYASRMLGSISSFSLNGGSSMLSAPYNRTRSMLLGGKTDTGTKKEAAVVSNVPLWKSLGVSLKVLGLAGFFFGDNVTFLNHSKFIKLQDPKRPQIFAMRSYFMASVVGWYVNYKELQLHRRKLVLAMETIQDLDDITEEEEEQDESTSTTNTQQNGTVTSSSNKGTQKTKKKKEHGYTAQKKMEAAAKLQEEKAKHFVLFLALLKSTADVLVFSNNPGVDLHKRWRGHKMNEGFHCLCGLMSAGSVLFNHFPNHTNLK